jgi:hypothetical protein
MDANNIPLLAADELGLILAQIAELTAKAEEIKGAMKDVATNGGGSVFEGNYFKASVIEANKSIFDKAAFVKEYGEDTYKKFTKVSASFSVRTSPR